MTAREILSQCTLEEKASLCSGRDFWTLKGIERLGLRPVMVTDGPHGLRKQAGDSDHLGINESVKATCFPAACTTACSFDPSLLYKIGEAMGEECLQEQVAVLLGPGANIKRSPLCGRNFEYFSEDPFLTGKLAASIIAGVQSNGIGTSLKHYAANNQEKARLVSNSIIDERALREIYLAGFEEAVKKSQPWTMMCSYNLINGIYAAQHKKLLTGILRDEWGFSGVVLSDWGATVDRIKDIAAGMDLEMPGSGGLNDTEILEAVKQGILDETLLDTAALRIIHMILQAQETLDPLTGYVYDAAAHHALARQAAAESAVLLKNDLFNNRQTILPLSPGKSLAVIGAFAKTPRYQGSGSSKINPTDLDVPFNALVQAGFNPSYAAGYTLEPGIADDAALLQEAAELAAVSDIALVFAGLPDDYESEGFDRNSLDMPESHNKLIETVASRNPNTIVVLQLGSPVVLPWSDKVKAILAAYLGGQAGGGAIADLLTGAVNPSGKLAESWPLTLEDTPAYHNFGGRTVEYRESIFVGYRYYDTADKKTAFPFGYGLSYTTFAYDKLCVTPAGDNAINHFCVSCEVTNTGSRAGAEVIQLYIAKKDSVLYRAKKELKGFEKIFLQPGETQKVSFILAESSFAYYNTAADCWAVEGGTYEINIGGGSSDMRFCTRMYVTGDGKETALAGLQKTAAPYFAFTGNDFTMNKPAFEALLGRDLPQTDGDPPFSKNSTLSDIKAAPGGEDIVAEITQNLGSPFGGGGSDIQRMFDAMFADMPLRILPMLTQGRIHPRMVEEIIVRLNGKKKKEK